MASKDLSDVALADTLVSACEIGLSAYRKKSEFGPGTLRVLDTRIEETSQPYLLEPHSSISIDGRPLAVNAKDIFATLYDE